MKRKIMNISKLILTLQKGENMNSTYTLTSIDYLESISEQLRQNTLAINTLIADFKAFRESKPKNIGIDAAAGYLDRSKAALYALIHRGEIPHSKIGGKVVFNTDELDNWISSKRKLTKAELKADAEARVN